MTCAVIQWLIHTREGFVARLVVGVMILIGLAVWDISKHGRRATRWREYAFLLMCVGVAIIYGIVNDQVTSHISWEYFYYGKELDAALGPAIPPHALALSREAAEIGAKATWSVGLILGVAILIANNSRRDRPQLSFRELIGLLPIVLATTIAFAVVFGLFGSRGWLNQFGAEFQELWDTNIWRPRRFMTAWGAHLGGYVGGLIGGAWAVWHVLRLRKLKRGTTSL